MKTSMGGFENFLKNQYRFFNEKRKFKSYENYLSYLKTGLKNINRSEGQLLNGGIQDFHQWIARIGDLPAENKKIKNYYDDQKVAFRAFMKYYKYINGIIQIDFKK